MLARPAVPLTPPKSFHPFPLPSRQPSATVSPLAATLIDLPASVANKRLTVRLSSLDATLTYNRGVGPVMVNQLILRRTILSSGLCQRTASRATQLFPAWFITLPPSLLPFNFQL